MRRILALLLLSMSLPSLAARGDVEICDPPPPSSGQECPTDTFEVHYVRPNVFASNPYTNDLCTRHQPDAQSTANSSWVMICEPAAEPPHPQVLCHESRDDHSVNCSAGTVSGGFVYAWAADGGIVIADDLTEQGNSISTFACNAIGTGEVTLNVGKIGGLTASISTDVVCTGIYETPILEEPCPDCIPIDPPPFDPVDMK
jgi:hypothetical protein